MSATAFRIEPVSATPDPRVFQPPPINPWRLAAYAVLGFGCLLFWLIVFEVAYVLCIA